MPADSRLEPAPLDSAQGAAAIFARAQARNPEAMRVAAVLRAAGVHCQRDWTDAVAWLVRAAVYGDFAARSELVALSEDDDLFAELSALETAEQAAPPTLWRRYGQSIDLDRLLTPPADIQAAMSDPLLATVERLASPRICQWLARRALPDLQPLAHDTHRTFTAMRFRLDNTGLPALALRERMAGLIGARVAQLEPTQVLRYEVGQAYAPHFDAFADDAAGRARMAIGGQRIATVLVSLNANYEGGETEFPTLEASYRGSAGQAIFWSNADQAGRRDDRTQHAGRPPRAGTKWVVSQWVRAEDYGE